MQYYGKYRSIVSRIEDPEKRGRIKVRCPSLLSLSESAWCEANKTNGDFRIPRVGESVWVEFENGDINRPIYSGTWLGSNEAPTDDHSGNTRVIEFKGNKVLLSDHLTLVSSDGTTLELKSGSILLNGVAVSLVTHTH
jgi:uncharacterized protein involved in type VI secretion and phage assembly